MMRAQLEKQNTTSSQGSVSSRSFLIAIELCFDDFSTENNIEQLNIKMPENEDDQNESPLSSVKHKYSTKQIDVKGYQMCLFYTIFKVLQQRKIFMTVSTINWSTGIILQISIFILLIVKQQMMTNSYEETNK